MPPYAILNPTRLRAFTLVEALVVIAVISVMAAILFAVMGSARESAQATSCLGNLKNIGVAVGLYTADHNERWPATVNAYERLDPRNSMGRSPDQDSDDFPSPMDILNPYVKAEQAFICPVDSGWEPAFIGFHHPWHKSNGGVSYLFANLTLGENPSQWVHPERQAYASDATGWWHMSAAKPDTPVTPPGRANKLFYDLHAATTPWAGVQ